MPEASEEVVVGDDDDDDDVTAVKRKKKPVKPVSPSRMKDVNTGTIPAHKARYGVTPTSKLYIHTYIHT